MGNPNWTRTARAPSQRRFAEYPPPPEAHAHALKEGKRVRDNHGELHHPCGCVVGLNLLNEVPVGPCPAHGEADAEDEGQSPDVGP